MTIDKNDVTRVTARLHIELCSARGSLMAVREKLPKLSSSHEMWAVSDHHESEHPSTRLTLTPSVFFAVILSLLLVAAVVVHLAAVLGAVAVAHLLPFCGSNRRPVTDTNDAQRVRGAYRCLRGTMSVLV